MVSVIIPTYNREKTIIRAIKSVLDQTYSDLELIVVDDCSTDNTVERIMSIVDPRLKLIKLEHNQGACVARNVGIEESNGEYIAFQDSDDEWYAEKLEHQLIIINKIGSDVCFHKVRRLNSSGREVGFFPLLFKSGFMDHRNMCNRTLITTQTILGRKEVFDVYKFDPRVKKTQDYDWGIRASRDFSFYYLDEVLANQYYQEDSISVQGMDVIKKTRQYYLQKYKDECRDNPQFYIFQLKTIAKCKTFLGENPINEYKKIYRFEHKFKNYLMIILCKMHLTKPVYILKEYIKRAFMIFYGVSIKNGN